MNSQEKQRSLYDEYAAPETTSRLQELSDVVFRLMRNQEFSEAKQISLESRVDALESKESTAEPSEFEQASAAVLLSPGLAAIGLAAVGAAQEASGGTLIHPVILLPAIAIAIGFAVVGLAGLIRSKAPTQ